MSDNLSNFVDDLIRYAEYLPPDENHPMEVIVLKWHLLIEEVLRQLILSKFIDHKAYNLNQTKYSTLLRLAKALYGQVVPEWQWEAARQLNTIRNSLAHSLEDETLVPRIKNNLFPFFSKNDPTFAHSDDHLSGKLGYCLSHTYQTFLKIKHLD